MLMTNTQLYIGCKIIRAYPATEAEFQELRGLQIATLDVSEPGYIVYYPDNYVSWSPKEVFEEAYRLVSEKEITLMNN
jgi:hypothetical protein